MDLHPRSNGMIGFTHPQTGLSPHFQGMDNKKCEWKHQGNDWVGRSVLPYMYVYYNIYIFWYVLFTCLFIDHSPTIHQPISSLAANLSLLVSGQITGGMTGMTHALCNTLQHLFVVGKAFNVVHPIINCHILEFIHCPKIEKCQIMALTFQCIAWNLGGQYAIFKQTHTSFFTYDLWKSCGICQTTTTTFVV